MAGYAALETLLDYRTLTDVYTTYTRSAPPNALFDFYTSGVQVKQFAQDQVEFITIGDVRDPAPTNKRANPARTIAPEGKGRRSLTMLNMFNAMSHGMDALQMLRDPTNWALQQRGKMELDQQIEYFALRHMLTKHVFVSLTLTGATVYVDANGDLRSTDPTTGYEIATGIPTANQSQVDMSNFGSSGNAISVAWDNPAALILDQLDLLQEAAEYNGSEPLKHVWLKRVNKKWLRNNDQILDLYNAGQERLDNALQGDTFEINNYTFHFYGGTWDDAGTRRDYIPATKAIITPVPGNWLLMGEGLQLVPSTIDIVGDMNAGISSWTDAYGDFSYVVPGHNPPSLTHYMGSNWLFGLKNPASIFVPTVDF